MNGTCRSSPRRYTNLPSSLPGYPRPSLALIPYSERTTSLGSGQWKSQTAIWFWFKLADGLRLNYYLPETGFNPVLSRTGFCVARIGIAPPEELMPFWWCWASVHQTHHHHHPRTRVGGAAPAWGSSASQSPVVFRPYPPWVVGAGSGRVPGPKFAAGTAAGAAGGFLGHREGQKSVGVCPLGGAHQSAWSLYIALGHTSRTEGVRRVRNGDFWKCV
jgi:hypothetical protein